MLPDSDSTIVRIVLNKLDQDSISSAVNKFSSFPVKVFVNCKSSKRTITKPKLTKEQFEEKKEALQSEAVF